MSLEGTAAEGARHESERQRDARIMLWSSVQRAQA